MTREEAISRLNKFAENAYGPWHDGDADIEAIDMAIEALSADTVSREQYDYVCEEYNRLVHNAICIKLCDENCEYEKGKTCYHAREHSAIEALKEEPAKHGEWEEKEAYVNAGKCMISEWQSARCSKCGKYHTTPYMYSFDNFNFCPNCGAKMKG